MQVKTKQLIGRREYISFPELKLFNIEAKIDTGAYTTALHCHDIRLVEKNGIQHLCFKPLKTTDSRPEDARDFCTKDFRVKEIKNSFGESENRYVIKTRIRIGKKKVKAFISLTDRGNMRYPVLLGRRILKDRFIVDVSEIYLSEPYKTKE